MKRVTRDRHLTPEEAAENRSVREKIEEEKPEINARIRARMAEKRPMKLTDVFAAQAKSGQPVQEVKSEEIEFSDGKAASSKIPPLHLIPTVALEKTAERFQLGIERKGDKAWNAISQNQEVLTDLEFLIERTSHIIHHAAKIRDKLQKYENAETIDESLELFDSDYDASAIVWGGMFLQCATEALKDEG